MSFVSTIPQWLLHRSPQYRKTFRFVAYHVGHDNTFQIKSTQQFVIDHYIMFTRQRVRLHNHRHRHIRPVYGKLCDRLFGKTLETALDRRFEFRGMPPKAPQVRGLVGAIYP